MPPVKYFSTPLLTCSTCCRAFLHESAGIEQAVCTHCGAYYLPSWSETPHDE